MRACAPPQLAEGKEETVKEFITRNLGDEVFYRLIEPFCSGVYAGDPTKLSMQAAFGKVRRFGYRLEGQRGDGNQQTNSDTCRVELGSLCTQPWDRPQRAQLRTA